MWAHTPAPSRSARGLQTARRPAALAATGPAGRPGASRDCALGRGQPPAAAQHRPGFALAQQRHIVEQQPSASSVLAEGGHRTWGDPAHIGSWWRERPGEIREWKVLLRCRCYCHLPLQSACEHRCDHGEDRAAWVPPLGGVVGRRSHRRAAAADWVARRTAASRPATLRPSMRRLHGDCVCIGHKLARPVKDSAEKSRTLGGCSLSGALLQPYAHLLGHRAERCD